MIKWERHIGSDVEKVDVTDVIDSLDASKSLVLKEMEFNPVIKENKRLKDQYQKHFDILMIVKEKFSTMLLPTKTPTYVIPKKKSAGG